MPAGRYSADERQQKQRAVGKAAGRLAALLLIAAAFAMAGGASWAEQFLA